MTLALILVGITYGLMFLMALAFFRAAAAADELEQKLFGDLPNLPRGLVPSHSEVDTDV